MADLALLEKLCKLVRYNILTSTTAAGSGHPTSSMSAVELAVALFFGGFFHFDLNNPSNLANDRFILSKGHASPLLYSLYHAAGVLTLEKLSTLRTFNSDLEGHPTPNFKYVDVATGSLGQGLSIGVGMALGMRLRMKNEKLKMKNSEIGHSLEIGNWKLENSRKPTVFVLMGDSEAAEGQVWEAAEIAGYYKIQNLVAILDVNRLGQRGETMLGWDVEIYAKRFEAFGWKTILVDDGHDLNQIHFAFNKALGMPISQPARWNEKAAQQSESPTSPTIIIAKTVKGKGVSFLENKDGWHGKAVPKDQLETALKELGEVDLNIRGKINLPDKLEGAKMPVSNDPSTSLRTSLGGAQSASWRTSTPTEMRNTASSSIYKAGDLISTREAYGDALVALGTRNNRIVALDAEVSNSTFSEKFKKSFPDRFFEMYIAEQNMISTALGFSKQGFVPFVSTFAAFLTRGFDQLRMSQYSFHLNGNQKQSVNIKISGSHAGVSIGADGPSQMALEDISMIRSILDSIVLYPSDAVSTYKLMEIMVREIGLMYLRTTRDKTPVLYDDHESFFIGGSKILKKSKDDKAVIFSAGITLHESLKAYDLLAKEGIPVAVVDLYSVKPIDEVTISEFAKENIPIVVVEDHYPSGGLGEAVLSALSRKFEVTNPEVTEHSTGPDKNVDSYFNKTNFLHLCVRKIPRSGTMQELLRYEGIDAEAIMRNVKSIIMQ